MKRLGRLLAEASEALSVMEELVVEQGVEEFLQSPASRYALRYAVIQFWEAVSDALYLLAETKSGRPPASLRESIELAYRSGIIGKNVRDMLFRLGRLRNIVVHRYWEVDDERLYEETKETLSMARKVLDELSKYAPRNQG